jgi:predicted dienelactone hydrolase
LGRVVRLSLAFLLLAAAIAHTAPAHAAACDAVLRDPARSRNIPVRLTMPDEPAGPDDAETPIPLILWSPGLGGGLAQGSLYAQAWAKAGLATLQFSHPGSDAEVYKEAEVRARAATTPEAARAARMARVREGTSSAQVNARLADLAFAVSQLPYGFGRCRTDRIDQSRLGIAGHSMGAWMAQILIGQRLGGPPLARSLFKAAVAVSGSPLAVPEARAASAAGITRPFLLVTGSLDGIAPNLPPEDASAQLAERTGLWPHLPKGGKYLYVAAGANHAQLAGTSARATPPALAAQLLPMLTGFWLETLKDGPKLQPQSLAVGDVFEAK